jgi:hypothetical protein
MISRALPAALLAVSACSSGDGAENQRQETPFLGVLEGEIFEIPESRGLWSWGNSDNRLCQQWSSRTRDSGHFYGTFYPWSNADVFVLQAPSDPLEVIAAENFSYSQDFVVAYEGDTVFFRGRNGFFGAWTVEEIDPLGQSAPRDKLSGRWYFKAGGGGDFTSTVMPSEIPMLDGNCQKL